MLLIALLHIFYVGSNVHFRKKLSLFPTKEKKLKIRIEISKANFLILRSSLSQSLKSINYKNDNYVF